MHIKIKKGLNIPLKGNPQDPEIYNKELPQKLALDLGYFEFTKFSFLKKVGETVKIGEPIAEDKYLPGRVFSSPANGVIEEITRGEKRRPLKVIIYVKGEEYYQHNPPDLQKATPEEIVQSLAKAGILPSIQKRPGNTLASFKVPEAIFVKAVESAPYAPDPLMQLQGNEALFQRGLDVLSKVTKDVHLIYKKNPGLKTIEEAKSAYHHTVEGPYPICSPSLHIYHIHPIMDLSQCVWSLNLNTLIAIGELFTSGRSYCKRVISVCGETLQNAQKKYFRVYSGHPISDILEFDTKKQRVISGSPLLGRSEKLSGYLGYLDQSICVVEESQEREFFHFMGLGKERFTATNTYLSGFLNRRKKPFKFTTHQHGEERAFVDGDIYQKVMPMRVPVMELVKSVIAEDFEKAIELGLLEVTEEDFALPTFVCPSKILMTEIIKKGLNEFTSQYLSE